MKKHRLMSFLLCVALVLGFTAPVHVSAENRPGEASFLDCTGSYAKPFVTQSNSAVLGKSTTIRFYIHAIDPSKNTLCIQIYAPHQDQALERFEIPIVQGCYTYSWTWNVPKSIYQIGSYRLISYLRDSSVIGLHSFDETYLNVVPAEIPATGMDISWNTFKADSGSLILYTDRAVATINAVIKPLNSTSDQTVVYRSSDPGVVEISEQAAGYALLTGKRLGTATVTAICGKLSASIPVRVKTVDSISIHKPYQTTFCTGQTFHMFTDAPDFTYIPCNWESSDLAVVYMDPEMPEQFFCGEPGTAIITASNGGKTDSVKITVRQHEPSVNVRQYPPTCTKNGRISGQCRFCQNNVSVIIPALGHTLGEDAVRIEPTATQPGALTGKCTVCGDENASIEIPPVFSDTASGSWYARHVDKVYDIGLMNGVGKHTFAPDTYVTRAMAATVLYRAAGAPAVRYQATFLDVPLRSYYTSAVIWAARNGIVKGYPDNTFRPDENITREQLAAILCRYAAVTGCDVSAATDLGSFPDGDKVHNYAKKAMGWAVGEKLITGVGVEGTTFLQPESNATRAQFATIISRYLSTIQPAPEEPDNPPQPEDQV